MLADRVQSNIKKILSDIDSSRVIISEPSPRQNEAKIVVETAECFEISKLVRSLPPSVKVYVREIPFGASPQVASKFEIIYPTNKPVNWLFVFFVCWVPPILVLFWSA